MNSREHANRIGVSPRGQEAEKQLKLIFERAGWKVRPDVGRAPIVGDLHIHKGKARYAVEVKSASEGRSDRLIPLFAQAALQSLKGAGERDLPLAVVSAPKVPMRVAEQVLEFAARYAPDVAAGVFDFEGLRLFRGPNLEGLNAVRADSSGGRFPSRRERRNLFSDLNQWMLKVLLAPELPDHLLAAPRGRYANASQLARAAQVSVMSAFRFIRQLHDDGCLDESRSSLGLVRRQDLFLRWQAANDRPVREVPMRFRLPGNAHAELKKVLSGGRACLALFAAADALGVGFVRGVAPHIYVRRLEPIHVAAWKNLRPCEPGEPPDLSMREPPAVQSVFRGMVRANGAAAADVLQVWLDVSAHPARGREQADLVRRRVLDAIIQAAA